MAGHSKWANIRFRKGAQDAKRGKLFTKLIREITVAAKMGGENLESNPRLRAAVDKGLSNNMTRDTINRAIKRGAGGLDGDEMVEIIYEGYGCNGLAVLVECLTDNRNRTVAEVRHAFSKNGGSLGTDGSVAYLFSKQGHIYCAASTDEERLLEVALEEGAEDVVRQDDNSFLVITEVENFLTIKDKLSKEQFQITLADITRVASTQVELDKDGAEKMLRLIDQLDDLDDVQNVYTNGHIPSDIVALMS